MRLDIYLARQEIALSRSQVQRLIDEKRVMVNGSHEKAGFRLRTGDMIDLTREAPKDYHVIAEDIPLTIVYEDVSIIVVDKPVGMVVHPAAGNFRGTLVNALLHHCGDLSGIGGILRPGIVHRLDKDTSGLIVIAKSDEAHQGLASQFKEHLVRKRYRAFVFGDMEGDEGIIDSPVGRHPTDRKKMSTMSRRGREALTRWHVAERYGIMTLLDVEIETGRTHQIRVHLNAAGHPLLGDNVYGHSSKRLQNIQDPILRSKLRGMKRQALHAEKLAFRHPVTGDALEFVSSIPEDMERIRACLRNYAGRF